MQIDEIESEEKRYVRACYTLLLSNLILSYLILSYLILSYLILSCHQLLNNIFNMSDLDNVFLIIASLCQNSHFFLMKNAAMIMNIFVE